MRAAAGGSDPTLRLALLVRSRHMRSGYVSRVCTMSSRLGIRSKPDDNESVADSLAFLLDCFGYRAAVAYDGETALRLLRTGAIEIRKPARHKRQCCPTVAEGNADSLRGFPRFNDERRCQSGRHCPALRWLSAEAVLLRGTHAGHRRRSLQQRREYSPSRLDQLLSTEAHPTHGRRFNGKPLPGHGAKRAAACSVNATFECLAE